MSDYSFISNAHPAFIESLYRQYQADPMSVENSWAQFFKGFEFATQSANGNGSSSSVAASSPANDANIVKEFGVLSIIHGFRQRGHLLSTTNPIRKRKDRQPHLDLNDYALSEADMDSVFHAGAEIGLSNATLRQILDHLQKIYCQHIGVEFAHIEDRERRLWLRDRFESRELSSGCGLPLTKKMRILEKLNGAVGFEKFLHTKYIGQKRFSLEGGETTIAALDAIINSGAEQHVEEVVIGMAHRGRLNVLANIMGKTYEHIFNEFEGTAIPDLSFGDGDVKYHLGYSSQPTTLSGKNINLKLVPNPSHLEAVNPVVLGFSRAKADLLYKSDYDKILPILIHGDAAAAGQGIMFETIQMSQLKGYYTGGTIHFVINNQIGFTTDFDDARSSTYCTGVASVVQAPVFHVNGDDPEAVIFASELATEYRQKFNSDVFIDMVCYRRHGHNEGDDPQFTQPEMYKFITDHPDPRSIYINMLVERGDMDRTSAEKLENEFWNNLQQRLDAVKQKPLPYNYQEPELAWKALKKITSPEDFLASPTTGVAKEKLDQVINHLMNVIPEGFHPLTKMNRLLKSKQKQLDDNALDWGTGELMAYGSLLLENKNVRISGQDVKRGTFSHRHAVLFDSETNEQYVRLSGMTPDQGNFYIYNSLLSEFGVLGFEYGYAMASPDGLVVWEAQFGDFNNGAQTMIDQFIVAGESKWQRMNGIVMLLPHGYEGQGPEHSSARLERFLQACAEYNVTVANITTPANFFHALRRQIARPFRKPLIVMSPKSLLRHPLCVSKIEDFADETRFQEVIDDANAKTGKGIKKVLFCSGKIYYDLLAKQTADDRKDVAIVRIEQLYPFPTQQIDAIMEKYKGAKCHWVQEEPFNMGAWYYIFSNHSHYNWSPITRKASASPATGFMKVHEAQQKEIVEKAFA